MRTSCLSITFFSVIMLCSVMQSSAELLTQGDRHYITKILDRFVDAINDKNYDAIPALVSQEKPELVVAIHEKMRDMTAYEFCYSLPAQKSNQEDKEQVRVTGQYEAEGVFWEVTGFSTYYVFEKIDGRWLIVDTDFYKGMPAGIWSFAMITVALFLFWLVLFVFWLWMFIDCAISNEPNKVTWILLLIFFNIFAALFYFFLVKRKRVSS